jgi:hypothetical protein
VKPRAIARWQGRSGKMFSRRVLGRGRILQLDWPKMQLSTYHSLLQWHDQYEEDFFSFQDIERGRYFSGQFEDEPQISRDGNNNAHVTANFVCMPGVPLFAYPTNWARDANFIEERDGFGNDKTKQTGVWTFAANANAHGGSEISNPNTNLVDAVELIYFGYGFRLWARKDANLGILSVSTSVEGTAELAPTNVDLYAAAPAASAALFTDSNRVLAERRVKILATNTKNAASAAKTIIFDAIEVMK